MEIYPPVPSWKDFLKHATDTGAIDFYELMQLMEIIPNLYEPIEYDDMSNKTYFDVWAFFTLKEIKRNIAIRAERYSSQLDVNHALRMMRDWAARVMPKEEFEEEYPHTWDAYFADADNPLVPKSDAHAEFFANHPETRTGHPTERKTQP